jgi:PHD/YefM family antitoxin component YafN of YafNO toxin-antitoxin module
MVKRNVRAVNLVVTSIEKPKFDTDQLISATDAAKRFGDVRKKAQDAPQFIMDNGKVNTVILAYHYYEQLFSRLQELEQAEETRILSARIEHLDNSPASGKQWRTVRRSEKGNE